MIHTMKNREIIALIAVATADSQTLPNHVEKQIYPPLLSGPCVHQEGRRDDSTPPSAAGDLNNLDDEGKFVPMELGMCEVHSEDVTRLKTSEYAPTPNVLLLSLS